MSTETFRQLIVHAETDAIMATVLAMIRRGYMTREDAYEEGLNTYAHLVQSLRAQLLDAESRRPRVYVLKGDPDVRLTPRFLAARESLGEGEDGRLG